MGAFGAEIFDDDVALDVRASAEAAMDEGLTMDEVTNRVMLEYGDYLEDSDDGTVVWLALAAVQLEHGAVEPEVRSRALAVIESGAGLDRWEEEGDEVLGERQRVLSALTAQLQRTSTT